MQKIIDWFLLHVWQDGKGDYLGAVLFGITLTTLAILKKRIAWLYQSLLRLKEKNFAVPKSIERYKKAVANQTIRLSHLWHLKGQTLSNIIVPVYLAENQRKSRIKLQEVIDNKFKDYQVSRLILLGDAGSGKSVALGVIARSIWNIKRKKILLPVLLNLADLTHVRKPEEMEEVIIQYLQKHEFNGKRKKDNARTFIKDNLYAGQVLLLLDGLDEIEKTARIETEKFLFSFFKINYNIPFVISCRTAVWEQEQDILESLEPERLYMASFTPVEIRQFCNQWQFEQSNKSGEKLAELINSKPFLQSIAVNPLLLTILTFLYAQPDRTLPDNRVDFYRECIDALLEKWDDAKHLITPDPFETQKKIAILSHIAYECFSNEKVKDDEISKSLVLEIIRKMAGEGPQQLRTLTGITEKAGLLMPLPPDKYTFPHRTFMEYFMAHYLVEYGKHEEIIALYTNDKGKWQECMAMFIGMYKKQDVVDSIVIQLHNDFQSTRSRRPDTFIFRVLVECPIVQTTLAEKALQDAEALLRTKADVEIIEQLGYIARKQELSYAHKARQILLDLLEVYQDDNLAYVIIALTEIPDSDTKKIIYPYLSKVDLSLFFSKVQVNGRDYITQIIESVDKDQFTRIANSIRSSGNTKLLFELMKNRNPDISGLAAYYFVSELNSLNFFKLLGHDDLSGINAVVIQDIDDKLQRYTWPWPELPDQNQQKLVVFTSICFANYVKHTNWEINWESFLQYTLAPKQVYYLTLAFLHEDGYIFRDAVFRNIRVNATTKGLISHWKKRERNDREWLSNLTFAIWVYFVIAVVIDKPSWFHILLALGPLSLLAARVLSFLLIVMIYWPISWFNKSDKNGQFGGDMFRVVNLALRIVFTPYLIWNKYYSRKKMNTFYVYSISYFFLSGIIVFSPLSLSLKLVGLLLLFLTYLVSILGWSVNKNFLKVQNPRVYYFLGKKDKIE